MRREGFFFVVVLVVIVFVLLWMSAFRLGGITSSVVMDVGEEGSEWLPALLIVLLLVLLVLASFICKGLARKSPPFRIEGNV
jgi:hypothetical protein